MQSLLGKPPCGVGRASAPVSAPFTAASSLANGDHSRRRVIVLAAEGGNGGAPTRKRRGKSKPKPDEAGGISLEDINPYMMGRRSRQLFDDVWQQFTKISSPTQSTASLDEGYYTLDDLSGSVFETPQAAYTTVLVVGATGRTGRILVRKLLLRGYAVRALVRSKEPSALEGIPRSVEVVEGDLGDYAAVRRAVDGCDKVICCAGARSTITADLARVEEGGVYNLGKAFLDAQNARARKAGRVSPKAKKQVAAFPESFAAGRWAAERVGVFEGSAASRRVFDRGQDSAKLELNERGHMLWSGTVRSRGGLAEAGGDVVVPGGDSLAGSEGLVLRLCGDGNQYSVQLTTESGGRYVAKLSTKAGWQSVRLPYNTFRPFNTDAPLNPGELKRLQFRFEPRVGRQAVVTTDEAPVLDATKGSFRLELDFIKALPGGDEPDIVLVSCAGALRPGEDQAAREKRQGFKRRGEAKLRNSGLGYCIVRPGPLVEEPGGYKALVFDQGNRIAQSISYADVADVCLKALHDPAARNKSFEVCSEYTPEAGLEVYELVAHLPDKANNYLGPALATLERNT